MFVLGLLAQSAFANTTINRDEYFDKLRGFWLGAKFANWTGLVTGNCWLDFPFYTDEGFSTDEIHFVFDQNPWGVDYGSASQYTDVSEYRQYYLKLFSKTDVKPDNSALRIECDGTQRESMIDMILYM